MKHALADRIVPQDVLITAEIAQRPTRAPDYETQVEAFEFLATKLNGAPEDALQALADTVVRLCRAGSAGISVSRDTDDLEWVVTAGLWAGRGGGTVPFDASPCGMAIQENTPLLFAHPERFFPAAAVEPRIAEVLLVPFCMDGVPAGTLWAVAHDADRHFDREDVRLLTSLSKMAAPIVRACGTQTASRAREDRLKIMVGELQHRARNLLSVVSALANQSVRTSRDLPHFRGNFFDRLSALGRAQDLLEQADGTASITFDRLLRTELTGLGALEGRGDQVRLDGPDDVILPPNAVQTLALALHELGTNALKYGALLQPQARLDITWTVDADENELHVEWTESGVEMGGTAAPADRKIGGGGILIERALPQQLDARTSFVLGEDGLRCAITLPLGGR